MAIAANLGFPRIGARRELKRAVEEYWAGTIDPEELHSVAAGLRQHHWQLQRSLGIEHIPSNDFSFYDHVLDTAAMVGAVPKRFAWATGIVDLATYFAMARGTKEIPPLDMTKWFDTNYHYIVPEFEPGMRFRVASTEPIEQFQEARVQGFHTRPVLLGPLTLLLLGKCKRALKPLSLLDKLLPVYEEILRRLAHAGADWVQIDEPVLALDLPPEFLAAFESSCARLSAASDKLRLCLTTYFGDLLDHLPGGAPSARGSGASRPGPRAEQLDRALESCAPGSHVVVGRGRRPERVANRPGAGVGIAGKGRGETRSRPDHGGAVLLPVALPDRPRPGAVA